MGFGRGDDYRGGGMGGDESRGGWGEGTRAEGGGERGREQRGVGRGDSRNAWEGPGQDMKFTKEWWEKTITQGRHMPLSRGRGGLTKFQLAPCTQSDNHLQHLPLHSTLHSASHSSCIEEYNN